MSESIGGALGNIASGFAKEIVTDAVRYGIGYVSGLVAERTGAKSVPSAVLIAAAPIIAELAAAAIDGSLTDPETGKLKREVRAQFEARMVLTLDEFGFLKKF